VKQIFKVDLADATDISDMNGTAAASSAAPKMLFLDVVQALTAVGFTTDQIPLALGGAPTVDLTVHIRTPLPAPGMRPEDAVLVSFRTREVSQGLLEEDGEIWSRDGRLLAHSRQLALLL
jgi:acyl-CoA thioesterase